MNRLFSSVVVSSLLSVCSLSAFAQVVVVAPPGHGVARPHHLARQAQGIADALVQHGHRLDARENSRVQAALERVAGILARAGVPVVGGHHGVPPGGGVVVTPPPAYGSVYTATCRIDDDFNLDSGAEVIGTLRGANAMAVLEECRQIARTRHGGLGRSLISNLRVENAPRNSVLATCQIDDDYNLSAGATVIGTLAAANYVEAQQECQEIARAVYGGLGRAAVTLQGYVP